MFHLSRDLLIEVAADLIGGRPRALRFPAQVVHDRKLQRLLVRLYELVRNGGDLLEKEAAMVRALSDLVLRHGKLAPSTPLEVYEPRMVALIKEHLSVNLETNVSMKELSGLAGMSVFHLLHVFRREVGLPPHAYQVQMRIQEARKLLWNGCSIVDAALQTGFWDQSHFAKKFKQSVGLTPRGYVMARLTNPRLHR